MSDQKSKTDFSALLPREALYPPGKIVYNGAKNSLDDIPGLSIERLAATIFDVPVPSVSAQIIDPYNRVKYAWSSRIIIAQATATVPVGKRGTPIRRGNSFQTTKSLLSKYKTYNLAELRDLQTSLGIQLEHSALAVTREVALYTVAIEVATRMIRAQVSVPSELYVAAKINDV